jgi:small GTP-binding protein
MSSTSGLPAFHLSMRILMIGDSGVGKTSLLNAFVGEEFSNPLTTIGVDYRVQTITLDSPPQHKVKLQIWDTAGQERFQTITPSYYRNCNGVILVYAADDPQSFVRIHHWLKQIEMYSTLNPKIIIVGNKYDMKYVEVSQKEALGMAAENGNIPLFFCSAKEKQDVAKPFAAIAQEIYKQQQGCISNKQPPIKLLEEKKHKKSCCASF